MDEYTNALQELMQKDVLTPMEVKEGVVACFHNTNRNFVKRRMGDVPAQEVDMALSKLIIRVFNAHNIDPEKPDIYLLKQAEQALADRTGFEREPDLFKMHNEIIQTLFSRTKRN